MAVYKSFVNENNFSQATINNFSLCYVFKALHRYIKRFNTTNIRREIIFFHIWFWSRVHATRMPLRRFPSMRLHCINTHKFKTP